MKRLLALLLGCMILAPFSVHAEITKADHAEIAQKVSVLFAQINEGKITEGYQYIFLPAVTEDPQALDPLIEATKDIMAYFNAPAKYQLYDEAVMGDVLVRQKYIVYTDKLPTTIKITFFRTSTGWYAQNIKVEDPSDEDFK